MSLRDLVARIVPSWLADNYPEKPSYGFRFLYVFGLMADAAAQVVLEGSLAGVARGTPTALDYVGQARGVFRGRFDTDESYAQKLSTWIDRARNRGTQRQLAIELHDYLGSVRVRVVNRHGHWVTCETDGTITLNDQPWDWDSVSHPERAGFDSELWVIVYPNQWPLNSNLDAPDKLITSQGLGIGHLVTRGEYDLARLIIDQTKSAHSKVRAVIWTTDVSLFDPTNPSSLPNGNWGAWGGTGNGSRVASDRNVTTCRYWECQ